MAPHIDIDALSGILGSISIACWVVVFTPQIIENFRRSSADGLSLLFIVIWLVGDIFNIIGAIFQRVLPTMTILAVYYTLADIVLLIQCLWYQRRGRSSSGFLGDRVGDDAIQEEDEGPQEDSPLLGGRRRQRRPTPAPPPPLISDIDRPARGSFSSSIRSGFSNRSVDATRLSRTTPFIPPREPTAAPPAARTLKPRSSIYAFVFNISSLVLVCGVGALGWWLTARKYHTNAPDNEDVSTETIGGSRHHRIASPFLLLIPSLGPYSSSSSSPSHVISTPSSAPETVTFDPLGQTFGYLCAVFYLGSRVPQLLLNYRRKSTEGVSLLFFLFACVGNLTYVLSIFAYEPACARLQELHLRSSTIYPIAGAAATRGGSGCPGGEWQSEYGKYILVNLSWLIGSAGTLFLDLAIFGQFWIYKDSVAPLLVSQNGTRGGENEDEA